MKIVKIYETVLNISAAEMYSGDIESVILNKLRLRFENKCGQNSLITSIDRVVKRSKIRQVKWASDGSGVVNVQFEASAVVYNEGDVLTGCEIQRIEKNTILCKHETAIITIKASGVLRSLRVGQKILIRISTINYINGREKITIHGTPWSYPFRPVDIYVVDNVSLSPEDTSVLQRKIYEIDEEMKLRAEIDKAQFKYFNDVFFAGDSKKDLATFGVDIVEYVRDLVTKKKKTSGVCITRHPNIDKTTPMVYMVSKSEDSGKLPESMLSGARIINQSAKYALLVVLEDILRYNQMIREMISVYPTEKDIDQHANLWAIYAELKKQT